MPALIEIVSVIDAAPDVVFDLELDVDVHAASLRGSQETATTGSTGRRLLTLGTRSPSAPAIWVCAGA